MRLSPFEKLAFRIYEYGWRCVIPFLKKNQRLADGFTQRAGRMASPEQADLWIQSASVGEAYLTLTLLEHLEPPHPLRVYLTVNTRQGMEILRKNLETPRFSKGIMDIAIAYFPFDQPTLMTATIERMQPKVMVLMESELWPGLLLSLKRHGCRAVVINGRMTAKSAEKYLKWPSLWRQIRPHSILAISKGDAGRFASVFGATNVGVMPNIKFDHLPKTHLIEKNPLQSILPEDKHFVVLGSTREEEETEVLKIVRSLLTTRNDVLIGLFPRHLHRLMFWEASLRRYNVSFIRRSNLTGTCEKTEVIVWDVFGELQQAYALAKAVFIGGSLAPLGGQNFLEALSCGIVPVIGPHWENFSWVGDAIVRQGLLRVAGDWRSVAEQLLADLDGGTSSKKIYQAARAYIDAHSGGARLACDVIQKML